MRLGRQKEPAPTCAFKCGERVRSKGVYHKDLSGHVAKISRGFKTTIVSVAMSAEQVMEQSGGVPGAGWAWGVDPKEKGVCLIPFLEHELEHDDRFTWEYEKEKG